MVRSEAFKLGIEPKLESWLGRTQIKRRTVPEGQQAWDCRVASYLGEMVKVLEMSYEGLSQLLFRNHSKTLTIAIGSFGHFKGSAGGRPFGCVPNRLSFLLLPEEVLKLVIDWGTDKFTAFTQNALLAQKRKKPLTDVQFVALNCKGPMLEIVKLRQDADDMVFQMGAPKQVEACPLSFEAGATAYAKSLSIVHWDPEAKRFQLHTVESYLDSEEHLLSSILFLGEGGLGKSKLMHMMAAEMCIAYDKQQYIFGKSIDALGILSFSGAVRASGALVLTDFEFKAARGTNYGAEALKSLLDVPEGGSIQGTRWRPALFPPGLPRLFGLNGKATAWGDWFRLYDQDAIGTMMDNLGDLQKATTLMAALGPDEQAACRRVSVAVCLEPLITVSAKGALRQSAKAKAAAGLARRKAARD